MDTRRYLPQSIVTLVAYQDTTHPFIVNRDERIGHLLDGALDHFPTRRYLPHAIVIDGEQLAIDNAVYVCDQALVKQQGARILRLVEIHDEHSHPGPRGYEKLNDISAPWDDEDLQDIIEAVEIACEESTDTPKA